MQMRQHFNVFMGCAYTNYSKLTLKEETYNQAESDSEENYSTEDKEVQVARNQVERKTYRLSQEAELQV